MIAVKMTIMLEGVGLMPLPGLTLADAEKELTEDAKAKLAEEIQAEWRDNMKKTGFELLAGSRVGIELIEV